MTFRHLSAIAAKEERCLIGLNSGTSMDGVDALVVEIKGSGLVTKMRTLSFQSFPFRDHLRERLLKAPDLPLEEGAHLHVELGRFFAACAKQVAKKACLGIGAVDLIGSHGQTLYHCGCSDPRRAPATFQAADLDVIAEETGVPTVGDFRARDVAAGGLGAPLMPYLDWLLFRERPRTVALNLGGIASLTGVAPQLEACQALDAGPANLPLDILARRLSAGQEDFDPGGRMAALGSVDSILLDRLLAHPYFSLPPPRSAGREMFGEGYLRDILGKNQHLALHDILATFCRFVAQAIFRAVREQVHLEGGPREVVVSGGGVHNLTLMRQLKKLFYPVPVTSSAAHGIDPDAKEALLFAVLANERLFGAPTNLPAATGARWPVSLGKLAF